MIFFFIYLACTGLLNVMKTITEDVFYLYSFNQQLVYVLIAFLTGFIMIPIYLFLGIFEIIRDKIYEVLNDRD
jgi:hypothetical protein